jgi:hypothetical protein
MINANRRILNFPEELMLVKNREQLQRVLVENKFDYIFFEHLRDHNLETVVKQGDLIRAVLNDIGKGSHMPVAVSLSNVSPHLKDPFQKHLGREYMEVFDGDREAFANFVFEKKRSYGIAATT